MQRLPDNVLCALVRRFVRTQAEALAGHLDGAKTGGDIEDVHQVRVTCRRLRAGLAFFGDCFDDDKAKGWRKALKKMLKRFGPARDCDVQITFLQDFLAGLDRHQSEVSTSSSTDAVLDAAFTKFNAHSIRPGIARLLLRLQQQRDALQPGLVMAVRRLQRQRLTMHLHLETERLAYEVEHTDEPTERLGFYERAAVRVGDRLAETLDKRPALDDPNDMAGHHALRIAVKKLRYTLELCDMALDGRLKKLVKHLKKLQTLLGDLHDCDVWDEQIEAFIAEETERAIAFYGHPRPMRRLVTGLRYLQTQQRQRREALLEQTAAHVEILEAEDFWNRIGEAVKENAEILNTTDDSDDEEDFELGQ